MKEYLARFLIQHHKRFTEIFPNEIHYGIIFFEWFRVMCVIDREGNLKGWKLG